MKIVNLILQPIILFVRNKMLRFCIMSIVSSITITFSECNTSDGSCTFSDGTNTFNLSSITADSLYIYNPGFSVGWQFDASVVDSSGVTVATQNGVYNYFTYPYGIYDTSGGCETSFYVPSFSDFPVIYNNGYTIYSLNGSTGETNNPLYYLQAPGDTASLFNNTIITPNTTTSPSSWTLTGISSTVDTCSVETNSSNMTFDSYISTLANIQNIAIAGTVAGAYELSLGSSTQVLTVDYIVSLAYLWYCFYGYNTS